MLFIALIKLVEFYLSIHIAFYAFSLIPRNLYSASIEPVWYDRDGWEEYRSVIPSQPYLRLSWT